MLCWNNNQEIETSFLESGDKNNKYWKEIDQHLAIEINTNQVLTHKNFGKKHASYVDTIKVRLESKEKSSIRNKIKTTEKESGKTESKESDHNMKKMMITMMHKMTKIMDTMITV